MIEVRIDDDGMFVKLQNSPRVTGVLLQKWMTRVVAYVHARVAENINDGGLLGRRTGTLARAIMDRIVVGADGVIGEVWPDPDKAPYGAIQEFGGRIFPRVGQALAIPLEAMLTANGVARGTAAQVKASPQAFGFASTFIPKGHHVIMGTLLGAGKRPGHLRGRDGSVVPLFALKPSVLIPRHGYLETTLTQSTAWIADQLEQLAEDAVKVIFGDEGLTT